MILVLQGKLVLLLGVVAIDGVSHTKVEGNQMWVGNIEDIGIAVDTRKLNFLWIPRHSQSIILSGHKEQHFWPVVLAP